MFYPLKKIDQGAPTKFKTGTDGSSLLKVEEFIEVIREETFLDVGRNIQG